MEEPRHCLRAVGGEEISYCLVLSFVSFCCIPRMPWPSGSYRHLGQGSDSSRGSAKYRVY